MCSTSRTCQGPSSSQAGSPTPWCCSRCGCPGRSAALEPFPSSPSRAHSRQGVGLGLALRGWGGLGAPKHARGHSHSPRQPGASRDDLWLLRGRPHRIKGQQKLIQWPGEEGADGEDEQLGLQGASGLLSAPPEPSRELRPEEEELSAQVGSGAGLGGGAEERAGPAAAAPAPQSSESWTRRSSGDSAAATATCLRRHRHPSGRSLWEARYGHLPRFLRPFVIQNWFKKLLPVFTLQVWRTPRERGAGARRQAQLSAPAGIPRGRHGGRPGRAARRPAARRLLGRPRARAARAAAAAARRGRRPPRPAARRPPAPAQPGPAPQPPGRPAARPAARPRAPRRAAPLTPTSRAQDPAQKQFVLLALQLLLACSLESRDVVLELMSYFLYSPASCR